MGMEMVTRQMVAQKLIDYMNGTLSLPALVDWAETALVDTPVEDALTHDVLAYLGAAMASRWDGTNAATFWGS